MQECRQPIVSAVSSYCPLSTKGRGAWTAESAKIEADRLFANESYRRAVELYSVAIELEPDNGKLYALRSDAELRHRGANTALPDAMLAVQLLPLSGPEHARLGYLLHEQGHWQEARQNLQKALALGLSPSAATKLLYEQCNLRCHCQSIFRSPDEAVVKVLQSSSLLPVRHMAQIMTALYQWSADCVQHNRPTEPLGEDSLIPYFFIGSHGQDVLTKSLFSDVCATTVASICSGSLAVQKLNCLSLFSCPPEELSISPFRQRVLDDALRRGLEAAERMSTMIAVSVVISDVQGAELFRDNLVITIAKSAWRETRIRMWQSRLGPCFPGARRLAGIRDREEMGCEEGDRGEGGKSMRDFIYTTMTTPVQLEAFVRDFGLMESSKEHVELSKHYANCFGRPLPAFLSLSSCSDSDSLLSVRVRVHQQRFDAFSVYCSARALGVIQER